MLSAEATARRVRSAVTRMPNLTKVSSRFLMLDGTGLAAVIDRDLPRLHGLGEFADQLDLQQTVLKRSVLHLDVLRQAKDSAEGTRRDTLVKVLAVAFIGLAALNRQHVLLRGNRDLVASKAGQRQRDLVLVLAIRSILYGG